MRLLTLVPVLALFTYAGAWDEVFKWGNCYSTGYTTPIDYGERMENMMPLSLSNLIALLEKYENQHTFNNIEDVANALIHRYQKNGIVFQGDSTLAWGPHEDAENWKGDLLKKEFAPQNTIPEDTFEWREECSLHFMLSHSTDVFPHAGVDDFWDGNFVRSGGYSKGRSKGRSNSGRRGGKRYKRRFETHAEKSIKAAVGSAHVSALSQDIGDTDPALHPVENGVIYSEYGPLAAGTLLRGIMTKDRTSASTIRTVLGDAANYMATIMQNKDLESPYINTLAGDIGQVTILSYASSEDSSSRGGIGSRGRFANSTYAPKQFSLFDGNDGKISHLTRAEIYAGLDALLIREALNSMSGSSSHMQLSEILRMYYSEHGMPGKPDFRACNRLNLWNQLDTEHIRDQALNFMYAYSHYIEEVKSMFEQHPTQEDFTGIENEFNNFLSQSWGEFTAFITNNPYEDYDACPIYNKDDVKVENNMVDVIVVFGHDTSQQIQSQYEYIAHLSMKLGVSEKRSRLGILDGKSAQWTWDVTNFTNVADWASNYTRDSLSYGSGEDTIQVFDMLTKYYNAYYNDLRSQGENAKAPAQIVVLNLNNNFDTEDDDFLAAYAQFNNSYRDVYKLFVSKTSSKFQDLMNDTSKDFFQIQGTTTQDMELFADQLVKRIKEVPQVFVYPACNDQNTTWENYNEGSHVYTGYVSPNFTTYIKISPQNFHFTGSLTLQFGSSDVRVCISRYMMNPVEGEEDTVCEDAPYDFQMDHLCGRYVDECAPIYIAVASKGSNMVQSCTDEECEFPNQISFEMRHDGMTCGGLCSLPAPVLLIAMLCLALFKWN